MASKRVVTCKQCGQRLSVPADRGTLKVRCKQCRAEWLWSPVDELAEVLELNFRCACTGQRFQVAFGRHHPNHRFRVVRVIFETVPEKALTVVTPSRSPSLVSRLLAPFRSGKSSAPRASAAQSFDANEFDFGGWYCPCCGYGQGRHVDPDFVQCGTCRELVCGGRTVQVNGGGTTFECHDGCRGGGRISNETIKKVAGAPVEFPMPSGVESSAALPQNGKTKGSAALPKAEEKRNAPPRLGG